MPDAVFGIDRAEIDVPCPKCGFLNPAMIREIRTRDVLICRGCKWNLQLDDHMNSVRKAEREIRRAVDELSTTFARLGNIELRI